MAFAHDLAWHDGPCVVLYRTDILSVTFALRKPRYFRAKQKEENNTIHVTCCALGFRPPGGGTGSHNKGNTTQY